MGRKKGFRAELLKQGFSRYEAENASLLANSGIHPELVKAVIDRHSRGEKGILQVATAMGRFMRGREETLDEQIAMLSVFKWIGARKSKRLVETMFRLPTSNEIELTLLGKILQEYPLALGRDLPVFLRAASNLQKFAIHCMSIYEPEPDTEYNYKQFLAQVVTDQKVLEEVLEKLTPRQEQEAIGSTPTESVNISDPEEQAS